MTPLVLIDLDDTIFQTRRKCAGVDPSDLALAAESANGGHSYLTPKQQGFVHWLLSSTETVPVTARGSGAFSAVKIGFRNHKVLANGALILGPDQQPLQSWRAVVRPALTPLQEALTVVLDTGRAAAGARGLDVRSWIVAEDGLGAYVVFKQNTNDGRDLPGVLDDLRAAPALLPPAGSPDVWTYSLNGNNLAIVPSVFSKRLAVKHLLNEVLEDVGGRPVIGFGDSLSDLGFLTLCDWFGGPSGSQLFAVFGDEGEMVDRKDPSGT